MFVGSFVLYSWETQSFVFKNIKHWLLKLKLSIKIMEELLNVSKTAHKSRATTVLFSWKDLQLLTFSIHHLVQKTSETVKNVHHSFLKPKVPSMNVLFCVTNSPKPKSNDD